MSRKSRSLKVSYNSSESEEEPEPTLEDETADDPDERHSINESSEDDSESESKPSGWADAISKVLQTKVNNKAFILSKAKKDRDISIREKGTPRQQTIEVLRDDGKITVEKSDLPKAFKTSIQVHNEILRMEWENMSRVKPSPADKEKDVFLNSIATKGVVQLFNAVKGQQEAVKHKLKKAGKSERKKDKALATFTKGQFLDTLKSSPKRKRSDSDGKNNEGWKVLRDDFTNKANLKSWDTPTA